MEMKSKSPRRRRSLSYVGVAVASLLCANGAVAAERLAGRDLSELLADAIRPEDTQPARADRTEGTTLPLGRGDITSSATSDDSSVTLPTGTSTATTSKRPVTGRGTRPGPRSSQPAGAKKGGPAKTTGTTSGAVPAASSASGGRSGPTSPGASGGTNPAPGASQLGTAPAAGHLPALERAVAELGPFVEREAGHTFKRPVAVRIVSDAEFSSRLAELSTLPKGPAAEQLEAVYRALAIIPPAVDLSTELDKFTRIEVGAFYDPVAQQLLVRSRETTPHLRSILARELTRALDDQWFDIHRPELDAEARDGLKALVEGDARRVRDSFVATLPPEERSQVEAENQRIASQMPQDIDPAVLMRFAYPSTLGMKLVSALLSAGGRARLDRAFSHPPTTTEHVFLPERYLAGEEPAAVAEPASDGAIESRGTLGHVGLLVLLMQAALDPGSAKRATDGWGGDRYVSWREADLTCVRATILADTAQDTAELAEALGKWAAARPGAEVSGSGPFTIRRCA